MNARRQWRLRRTYDVRGPFAGACTDPAWQVSARRIRLSKAPRTPCPVSLLRCRPTAHPLIVRYPYVVCMYTGMAISSELQPPPAARTLGTSCGHDRGRSEGPSIIITMVGTWRSMGATLRLRITSRGASDKPALFSWAGR